MDPAVAPSPRSTNPGTPAEPIHYALKAESLGWRSGESKPELLCWPVYRSFYSILLPGAIMLAFTASEFLPGPQWLRIGAMILTTGSVLVPHIIHRRRVKQLDQSFAPEFPPQSDRDSRVRVAGRPTALRQIRTTLTHESAEFEPRVFRVGRPTTTQTWREWTFISSVFLLTFISLHVAADLLHIRVAVAGMLGSYAALTVTFLVWAFCWPTYLRVVPGRLDVLNYNFLGRGVPNARSIDLRTNKLLVLTSNAAVIVVPGSPRPLHLDAGPLPFHPPNALDIALLAAAISTAPTPPLPTTELTG